MIDLEKQYRTKGGYEVKLNFIKGETVYGHFTCWKNLWSAGEWNVNDGIYSIYSDSECDLVEVKPRIKHTVWMNVYKDDVHKFFRRKDADDMAHRSRLACVKVEIDCEVGDGL
jgi:hypothetical protein